MVSKFSGKLVDNFFENHRINVEPHHVQKEEVTHLAFLHDDIYALLLDQSESDVKQVSLKFGKIVNMKWKFVSLYSVQ